MTPMEKWTASPGDLYRLARTPEAGTRVSIGATSTRPRTYLRVRVPHGAGYQHWWIDEENGVALLGSICLLESMENGLRVGISLRYSRPAGYVQGPRRWVDIEVLGLPKEEQA